MTFFKSLPIFIFLLLVNYTHAATFDIRNNCPFTVWPAAIPVGGGRQLGQGQTWSINIPGGTAGARIWARTNCNFDGSGRGRCQTGDCNGLLQCQGSGQPPATLAEFSLNQFSNLDFYDLSVIDGFNVPMEFSPNSGSCKNIRCTGDINGQCPAQLRAPGGCNNIPSDVPTDFSRYFKARCPDAYTYSKDDTATFSCPGGNNYRVVFCP